MRRGLLLAGTLILASCAGTKGVAPPERARTDPIVITEVPIAAATPAPVVSIAPDPLAVPSTANSPDPVPPPAPSERPAESPPTTTSTTTTSTSATTTTVPPTSMTTTTTTIAPATPTLPEGWTLLPNDGAVALTFDDGPFVGWTEAILDVLDRQDVTATFFVSTYLLPANAHLIPRMVEAGHSVQTHGDQHNVLTGKPSEEIRSDLQTSIDKLVAAGAPRPTCFRPPHGMTDLVVESVATDLGLEVVGWSLNSLDYEFQEPQGVIDTVLAAGPGDVVLLHDHWAEVHVDTLPVIVAGLRARGLEFGPMCAAPQAP